jgi:hypothetical protein
MAKICFITAIYGAYEATCKKFVRQSIQTDFICFTDNRYIKSNGWLIDTTPYHLINKSNQDNDEHVNSLSNNKHTFNKAKYYKQAFHNIPRLQEYDVVVWIDGTIQITNEKTSEFVLNKTLKEKILGWHHEQRFGSLEQEVKETISFTERYSTTFWHGQSQPFQDAANQWDCYKKEGYDESYFRTITHHGQLSSPHFGMWCTCFVAFLHKDWYVKNFLDLWYLQTLKYTTQDQIGFPFVVQKTGLIPFTLPDNEIKGKPHEKTDFFVKRPHHI